MAHADPSMIVHREWAKRPDDERHLSLHDLYQVSKRIKEASKQGTIGTHEIDVTPKGEDLVLKSKRTGTEMAINNWSGSQLSALSGIPLAMAAAQPADLAARNFNWGLRNREAESIQLLITDPVKAGVGATALAPWQVRAMTGPKYGRIFNDEVLAALIERFGDGVTGEWRVPGIRGTKLAKVTKENTTIYGGQQDFFVFLADEDNRIIVPGRRDGKAGSLARGVYFSNSEVGSGKLRVGLFLYDFLCANRIIWGLEAFMEIAIRHSSGAPARWLSEAMPQIKAFQVSSAKPAEDKIKAAQTHLLGSADDVLAFMTRANRFTISQSRNMAAVHVEEEGRPIASRWDVVTAATAYAKSIPYANERFTIEQRAGALLA